MAGIQRITHPALQGMCLTPFAPQHGRHIFIYKHIDTNQVIYSLRPNIYDNATLKQLTFYGKKTVPSRIRKDLWVPMATVSFPTYMQGLEAYRKLREYRRVRDLCWDPPNPDGPLPNRHERKKLLRDHKATSIADLADVLIKQELKAHELIQRLRQTSERQAEEWAETREKRERELIELAERASKGDIERVEEELKVLTGKHERRRPAAKVQIAKQMLKLRQLRNKLKAAQDAVLYNRLTFKWEVKPDVIPTEPPPPKANVPVPKRGVRRRMALGVQTVVRTLEGVRIDWADVLDMEFAERWPTPVVHQEMVWQEQDTSSRRLAPFPPIVDWERSVQVEAKKRGWGPRRIEAVKQDLRDGKVRLPTLIVSRGSERTAVAVTVDGHLTPWKDIKDVEREEARRMREEKANRPKEKVYVMDYAESEAPEQPYMREEPASGGLWTGLRSRLTGGAKPPQDTTTAGTATGPTLRLITPEWQPAPQFQQSLPQVQLKLRRIEEAPDATEAEQERIMMNGRLYVIPSQASEAERRPQL